MKKILLIIAFMVGLFAMQAQTVKTYMYPAGTYTKTYTGTSADTLGVGQTTISIPYGSIKSTTDRTFLYLHVYFNSLWFN